MPKVRLHDISLYYEVYGNGDPLLFISGLGSDSSSWLGVVEEFSPYFQTILFDNRGAGRSGRERKPHTIHRMADDALGLLDHLKIKRAHVIGHSMGGYIAQDIAIHYPGRIDKLILESTGPISSKRNNALFFEFYNKLRKKENIEDWVRAWTFWLFSQRTLNTGSFVDNFVKKAAVYPFPVSAGGLKAQAEAIAKFDSRGRLSAIKAKTLVMEGEEDILIKSDEARGLAKHIRGSVIRIVKASGHSIHIEKPVLFAKIAVDFLKRP